MSYARHQRIGIVGAGSIGRGWAIVFARAGCMVSMYDNAPDVLATCDTLINESLEDMAAHGLLGESPSAVLARITRVTTVRDVLQDAVLVQENVHETPEAKAAIFAQMDRFSAPETILASSSSGIVASSFSSSLPGRGRVMVAHPVNPPHLVPLVEVVPAPWTTAEAIERARTLYAAAGQTPVVLKKEVAGFLLNRLQAAVLNEALNLFAGGYVGVEDLDKVMKDGLGMRWSFMGPFETIDLNAPNGVLDYAARYGSMYRKIAREQARNDWPPELLARIHTERRAALPQAILGERARWRDNRLMALVAHRRTQYS